METLGQEDVDGQQIRTYKDESDIVSELSAPFNEASSLEEGETSSIPEEQNRRGSRCKQIRPLPTFVKPENQNYDKCENDTDKIYIMKVSLQKNIIMIKSCI